LWFRRRPAYGNFGDPTNSQSTFRDQLQDSGDVTAAERLIDLLHDRRRGAHAASFPGEKNGRAS
jgi:hypothetical protein